ncbi:MAG TPA: kelch repeat-containing protein [Myxococcaceae bacterium]|nr:kelch repeat-containing protein [Myxococcaceae bacterium]
MSLAGSITVLFMLIAAGCATELPESSGLPGQLESALGTGWQATTPMPEQRIHHSATVLASNKVLVVGGWSYNSLLSQTVVYDPASATWTSAGTLARARQAHTATLLPSGKVLVVGGEDHVSPGGYTNTAELYDPAMGAWSPAGATSQARGYNTATVLQSGKVLIVGGLNQGGPQRTVDLYEPSTNSWSPMAAPLLSHRRSHTATLLASGKVLVTGGWGGNALDTVDLYEPATNTWTAGPAMSAARYGHTATALPSGKILVAGGQGDAGFVATAELYDPATQRWAPAGGMASARAFHTATLVGGKVLVAGGRQQSNVAVATAEVYDPSTNSWSSIESMVGARSDHATVYSAPLSKVLAIGGWSNSPLRTAELYDASGFDSCTDGVKNGNESDVDCGGACQQCAFGKTCAAAADCASGVCAGTSPGRCDFAGLVLSLDSENPASYPGSGSRWYDLSPRRNDFIHSGTPNRVAGAGFYFWDNGAFSGPTTGWPDGATDRTILAWAKPLNGGNYLKHLFHYGTDATNGSFGLVHRDQTRIGSHEWGVYPLAGSWGNGELALVGVRLSGGNVKTFFKNGASVGADTSSTPATRLVRTAWVGSRITGLEPYYGYIRNIRVYNRALTDAEIAQLHAATKPTTCKDSSDCAAGTTCSNNQCL